MELISVSGYEVNYETIELPNGKKIIEGKVKYIISKDNFLELIEDELEKRGLKVDLNKLPINLKTLIRVSKPSELNAKLEDDIYEFSYEFIDFIDSDEETEQFVGNAISEFEKLINSLIINIILTLNKMGVIHYE